MWFIISQERLHFSRQQPIEKNSASSKNCHLSTDQVPIDNMKQLSINKLIDMLHPLSKQIPISDAKYYNMYQYYDHNRESEYLLCHERNHVFI